MTVETHELQVFTKGNNHVVDLSQLVAGCLADGSIQSGTVTVFAVGSTAGVTTTEYEPGLARHDIEAAFEKLAPQAGHYAHEQTWHDDNGHSHVRAALLGPSLTVPLVNGRLTLGTWQQIVLLDFDTRSRTRDVIVQVIGE